MGHRTGLGAAIVVLILLNISLLGLLWYEHLTRPKPPPPRNNHAENEVPFAEELQLDQNQVDAIRRLRQEHFDRTDPIRIAMVHLDERMMEQLFAPTPDTALVRELSEQIGSRQAEFDRQVYSHFDDIKQRLRPDQYEKLHGLIFDALRKKLPSSDGAKDDRQTPEEPGIHGKTGQPPRPPDRR